MCALRAEQRRARELSRIAGAGEREALEARGVAVAGARLELAVVGGGVETRARAARGEPRFGFTPGRDQRLERGAGGRLARGGSERSARLGGVGVGAGLREPVAQRRKFGQQCRAAGLVAPGEPPCDGGDVAGREPLQQFARQRRGPQVLEQRGTQHPPGERGRGGGSDRGSGAPWFGPGVGF